MANEQKLESESKSGAVSESFLNQVLDSTGLEKEGREEAKNWLSRIVNEADRKTLRPSQKILNSIDDRILELDRELSLVVNKVMHNEKFQKLEGSWRGLYYLVSKSILGSDLRIQCMDITKDEIIDEADNPSFQKAELYRKVYTRKYNTLGGVPLGTIIGDYEWSHSASDVKGMTLMAQICASSHAPFITSPAAKMFGIPKGKSWEHLENLSRQYIEDRFLSPDVAEMIDYRAFREMEDSRYVSMCLPRVMARLPYGKSDCEQQIKSFGYQEFELGKDGKPIQTEAHKYCWMNASYTMGLCMSNAFRYYGWAVSIRGLESGGMVEDLPIHYFTSKHSDTRVQCPSEVPLPMSQDALLGKVGFLPLIYELNSNHAVFLGGQTVHVPKKYDDSAAGRSASANENLSARLPYIMAVSRVAHALQPMLRIQIGKSKEANEIEDFLNRWFVNNYVLDQDGATEESKARKPFRSAQIKVTEDETDPGVYNVRAWLRPHFQVEEINVGLSLVAKRKDDGK